MKELLAYVGAELRKPEEEISDDLVFLINSRIKPPKPVAREDIFVRTMFLVSDEVNSYGGRFPSDELYKISQLVIDSPVMVGHTKEKLPIARNFKAEVVQRDGQNWVKVWFYWLKNARDALSLKENIDHGIYKECSLGFVFEFPQCSICGEDMRRCRHLPLKTYATEEGEKEAHFTYRNITRVLETSLVYRGAVPNTSISDQLWLRRDPDSNQRSEVFDPATISQREEIDRISPLTFVTPTKPTKTNTTANEIFHLHHLTSLSGVFLIEPKYDGIRAQVHRKESEVKIFTDQAKPIEQKFLRLLKEFRQNPQASFILDGELVKYKGNSRLSHKEATSYVLQNPEGSPSMREAPPDDSHFKFKLFDLLYLNGEDRTSLPVEERKRLLADFFPDTELVQKVRYEKIPSGELSSKIKTVASSEGAMIKRADSGYFEEDSWYKWKKHLELDVLVTGVDKNEGGTYNYTCALGAEETPTPIGSTYSTSIVARAGDIIRVRVDHVSGADGHYAWRAPRVLERRPDKTQPDPISVLKRMTDEEISADGRVAPAGPLPTEERFVLQLHWWGEAKHHDLRLQKGKVAFGLTIFELDLDELNRGRRFLCEWKDEHDPKWMDFEGDIPPNQDAQEGNPSKNLVAHMKIIDRGKYQFLRRESDFSSIQMKNEALDGTYQVRRIKLKGKDRWLFCKLSTE